MAMYHLNIFLENCPEPDRMLMKHCTWPHYTVSPNVSFPINLPHYPPYREQAQFTVPSEMKVVWEILIVNPEKRVSSKGFKTALWEVKLPCCPTISDVWKGITFIVILQHCHSSLMPNFNLQPKLCSWSCCYLPSPSTLILCAQVIHLQMHHKSDNHAKFIQAALKFN